MLFVEPMANKENNYVNLSWCYMSFDNALKYGIGLGYENNFFQCGIFFCKVNRLINVTPQLISLNSKQIKT